MSLVDGPTEAFQEFRQNLGYARQLVQGGRRLGQLKVGAFDVDDLYRAAWVQAVAALDHWVTREIIDRAVALAKQPSAARPPKFSKLTLTVDLFEQVHHGDLPVDEAFRAQMERTFEFRTFQNHDKIKEGLAHVSTVNLWPQVARILTAQSQDGEAVTADLVRTKLEQIAQRRNQIAHTADRDPASATGRAAITAEAAIETIDWLEKAAAASEAALGKIEMSEDAEDPLDGVEASAEAPRTSPGTLIRGRSNWNESSLLEHLRACCSPPMAATILAVYRHAETHPAFRGYYFGEGAHPSVTAWFHMGNDEAAVWSIYTSASKATLALNFQWMRDRGASHGQLERLAKDLSVLVGWANLPAELKSADNAKRPSLGPIALSEESAARTIVDALNRFLETNTGD